MLFKKILLLSTRIFFFMLKYIGNKNSDKTQNDSLRENEQIQYVQCMFNKSCTLYYHTRIIIKLWYVYLTVKIYHAINTFKYFKKNFKSRFGKLN
jgi:hypothetical protein